MRAAPRIPKSEGWRTVPPQANDEGLTPKERLLQAMEEERARPMPPSMKAEPPDWREGHYDAVGGPPSEAGDKKRRAHRRRTEELCKHHRCDEAELFFMLVSDAFAATFGRR
jgi:hypothetical protein